MYLKSNPIFSNKSIYQKLSLFLLIKNFTKFLTLEINFCHQNCKKLHVLEQCLDDHNMLSN